MVRRICIYCQTWESGGIEAFIYNILTHMEISGLEIDIVVEVQKESVFTNRLKARGIRFRELSGSHRRPTENYRRFAKLMGEQRYDVLHLNVFQALQLSYLHLAKKLGIPVRIAHSHNTMLRRSKTRVLKMGIHKIARMLFAGDATEFWACSQDAADFLFPAQLIGKRGCRVVPNGIALQRFQFNAAERLAVRKRLHLENAFVVGNVGRLCQQKNQKFLLEVFGQVHAAESTARLLLVGEGEMLTELQKETARLSLDDVVIFYGTSTRVEELLWAMDVFVFPSIFEGLGIVAIEAQAAGLPTICSDRVPQEAFASRLAKRLPLLERAGQWAQTILNEKGNRGAGEEIEQLSQRGFEIADVGRSVEMIYRTGPTGRQIER